KRNRWEAVTPRNSRAKPFLLALSLFVWAHCRRHERIHYSPQGYDSESGAPWAARLRHDDCVAKPSPRGGFRTQQHDSGDGDLLWRRGANCGWDYGMAERQHFRHHRVSVVRLVLVLARRVDYSAKVGMGHGFQ